MTSDETFGATTRLPSKKALEDAGLPALHPLGNIIRHLRKHPEKHFQANYGVLYTGAAKEKLGVETVDDVRHLDNAVKQGVKASDCGTAFCIAGTACVNEGYQTRLTANWLSDSFANRYIGYRIAFDKPGVTAKDSMWDDDKRDVDPWGEISQLYRLTWSNCACLFGAYLTLDEIEWNFNQLVDAARVALRTGASPEEYAEAIDYRIAYGHMRGRCEG